MNFEEFHEWVHREIGINLSAYKPAQLDRRISSLMTRNGIKTLDEYTKVLKTNSDQKQKFLDFITINVTEFFRNPELFSEFETILKNDFIAKNNKIKIWSAACSIGCEPYSVAMILKKINPRGVNEIIATDIDNTILARAKKGEYTDSEIKNIPEEELKKNFTTNENKYLLDNNIKSMVKFKKHDLILDKYDDNFDVIICRNVVIYFNNDIKANIYKRFYDSLKKGGILFVGATESIYGYKEYGFEKVSTFIYRKV